MQTNKYFHPLILNSHIETEKAGKSALIVSTKLHTYLKVNPYKLLKCFIKLETAQLISSFLLTEFNLRRPFFIALLVNQSEKIDQSD